MREHLKERRKELGLTLEQVGDSVGVGKSTVRRWENGLITNMGSDKVKLLAKALKVSPSFVLGYTDDPDDNHLSSAYLDFDERETIEKLLKETLPAYTPELAQLTYEAMKLDKGQQRLLLSIIVAIGKYKTEERTEKD
ncbi:helix-turn-helix domain-containing protein [Macrococcus capreoli]